MSVDQKDVVDLISTSPDGNVVLRIADHLFWDEKNEHLLILQDKLNSYLRFIESGEIFDTYPSAKNSSLVIEVCLKYEPNETGLSFLKKCQATILNIGIGFQWREFNQE